MHNPYDGKSNNLNTWSIDFEDDFRSKYVKEINTRRYIPQTHGDITVYFAKHEEHLANCIFKYPVVVGCVAWLTNETILKALAKCKVVSIVVQKEDFLRPDSNAGYSSQKLQFLYSALPKGVENTEYYWGELVSSLYCARSWESAPIRWMGNFNSDRKPAFPRMHHKFLVFCNTVEHEILPEAVWTGSFNMTYNGTQSLENCLLIQNKEIARLYYDEWARTFALSESIDIDWGRFRWEEPKYFSIRT